MAMSNYDIRIDELDESSTVAEQPLGAKVPLKRHQLTLLARCMAFESEKIRLNDVRMLRNLQQWQPDDYLQTRIGILGDRAGSGKSYVLLALMMENQNTGEDSVVKSYGCNRVILCTRDAIRAKKTNLLVIPHNMCSQWDGYVKTFTDPSKFKHMVIYNTKMLQSLRELDHVDEYDLIIVTCTCYNRVAELMTSRSVKFHRLIFDEVDNVNLPSCSPMDAAFTWFVTASFGNLLYPRGFSGWDSTINKYVWRATGLKNSGYVKNLFIDLYNNVSTDYVKVLVIKNKDAFVLSSINLPPTTTNMVLCRTPTSISLLHGVVDNAIIDSLNAGDLQGAIQHVSSDNKNTEEHIVTVILDKMMRQQKSLENRLQFYLDPPAGTFESEAERTAEIGRLQKRMEEVTRKMQSIRDRIANSDSCCICFDTIEHKTITPCCSNSYCFRCINMWLARKNMCPLCKRTLVSRELFVVQDGVEPPSPGTPLPEDEVSEKFDKIKNLEIILKKRTANSKYLIFASYDNTFTHITSVLEKLGVQYSYLKGNHDVVRNIVRRYKTPGDLPVLLVNVKNYGTGMNLENTTDIIMFHKFDTEIEKQVVGRANRMGRTEPLNVWYLLYENEMMRVRGDSTTTGMQ
jgi:SNF2 family DNA or RNA helicase